MGIKRDERPAWLDYELLARASNDGLWAIDPQRQTIFVNQRLAEILGRPVDDVVGRPFEDFVDPEWQILAVDRLSRVARGRDERFDLRFLRADGKTVWGRVDAVAARNGDGQTIGGLAIIGDIAAEKRVEGRLQEVEVRLREAGAYLPGIVYQVRLVEPGYLLLEYVSDSIRDFLGEGPDELIERRPNVYDLIHPGDVEVLSRKAREAAATLGPVSVSFRLRLPGGEERTLLTTASVGKLDNGDLVGYGAAIDVTERRRVEEALQESRAQVNAVFDNLPFDVWSVNDEARVILQNPTSLELWGDRRGGRLYGAAVGDDVASGLRSDISAALAGKDVRREVRVSDGEDRIYDRIVAPVLAGDAVIGALGVSIDVTEKHRLEGHLLQAQKLDAIGRLAGGVAHDFNNVLTAIFSCVRLLERRIGEGSGRRELDVIREGCQRASALTKQLIAFARQEMVAPANIRIDAVLTRLDPLLRRVIGEDVELSIATGAGDAEVCLDLVRFEQVLFNLVVNARDAMPTGGRLRLESTAETVDDSFRGVDSMIEPGGYVVVRVVDTGVGMTAEVRDRAFEPFFTTRKESGGSGLGLSTALGIVRQAGGHLLVTSNAGRGTTVWVYLPIAAPCPAAEPELPEPIAEPVEGGETILLVEDDPLVMGVTAELLVEHGYEVLEASSAAEALRVAQQHAGRIDLLLTDVILPRAAGTELSRALCEQRPDLAVLFVSGHTAERVSSLGLTGEFDYLSKPFTPESLISRIREILERDG